MSLIRRFASAAFAATLMSLASTGTASAQWGYYPGYGPFGPPVYAYPPVVAPAPVFVAPPPIVTGPAYAYPPYVVPGPVVYSRGVVPYNYIGPRGRLRVGFAPAVYGVGY